MSARAVFASSAAVIGLVLVAAWLFSWPLEKAVYLAPIIVVAFAAAAGILVLWTRVVLESLRRARRPRLVVAIAVAVVVVIGILSALGVELPRETG